MTRRGGIDALYRVALAVAVAVMAGCASLAPPPAPVAVARLPLASHFQIAGRVSASDGYRAATANIAWQHDGQQDHITFSSPFGQTLATLSSSPDGSELVGSDGRRVTAPSASDLTRRVLGIPVPLERLTEWLQAVPPAGAVVTELDAVGRPAAVVDRDWLVSYLAYMSSSPLAMPRRIEAVRGDTRLKLVVDDWSRGR